MRKSILEIYALTVCFFAVVCFVVVSALAVHDAVQIIHPEFTMSRHQYERYMSNEAFIQAVLTGAAESRASLKTLPRDEITRYRVSEYKRVLHAERHDGKRNFFKMLVILVIDAIAFAIHWQIGHGARQEVLA